MANIRRFPRQPATGGLRLKVSLRRVRPPIWRRVVVPASCPLGVLSTVLEEVMGWGGGHLHAFRLDEETIGDPRHFPDHESVRDERSLVLHDVLRNRGDRLVYEYDFGDGWEHDVVVEAVLPVHDGSFVCTTGRRACPPDDCGGPYGYAELLHILAHPEHPEHAERMEWCGPLSPAVFDLDTVNLRLAALRPGGASTGEAEAEE
jgi:hypothetical protein